MFSSLLVLASAAAGVSAIGQGFNYDASADFTQSFKTQQTLQGTSGFNSARLYTMIAPGTTNTPTGAIQSAIDTKTTLLLGLWGSGGQATIDNELAALQSAITQHGSAFTDLVVGISVGSEDLYRISPTGIMNKENPGAGPDTLVSYIKQTRSTLASTALSHVQIGHVDTWTAWVNGSNAAVIQAVDFLGFDGYPYFQTTDANSIDNAKALFYQSYDATVAVANGKTVWVTETGWPVSGPNSGAAVASVENAQRYWDEVGCSLFGKVPTYWYILADGGASPSFGLVSSDATNQPLYNLTCPSASASVSATSTTSVDQSSAASHGSQAQTATGGLSPSQSPLGNSASSSATPTAVGVGSGPSNSNATTLTAIAPTTGSTGIAGTGPFTSPVPTTTGSFNNAAVANGGSLLGGIFAVGMAVAAAF